MATMPSTDMGTSIAAVRSMRPTSPRTSPWMTAPRRNSTSRAAAKMATDCRISLAAGPANHPSVKLTVDDESR